MTADKYSKILRKLSEQEREEGKLPLLLEFYRKLLEIRSRAQKGAIIPEPHLSKKVISERLDNGLPLIRFDDLTLDLSQLRKIFVEVIAAFTGYPELFGEVHEKLRGAGAGRLLTKKVLKAGYEGTGLPPSLISDTASDILLHSIIQATLKPLLANYSQGLISLIDQERWRRGYCPICGGIPDFAFLDTDRGSRWLVCSRCDTEWVYKRLECPYCGTQDQKALAYFTDDKGLYRLYVCEKCKRYLKAIDLRQAGSEVLLPLERFYTLDIDLQAQKQGYKPHDSST